MNGLRRPERRYPYIADGPEIYVDSFATIRREAELEREPRIRRVRRKGEVPSSS